MKRTVRYGKKAAAIRGRLISVIGTGMNVAEYINYLC